MKKLVMAVCMAIAAVSGHAEEVRSAALIQHFKEQNVCPATGKVAVKGIAASYRCPGYVVDHGIPFCAGQYLGKSLDVMYNLSYQKYDKDNSMKKDADENLLCDTLKKYVKQ
jgi:hypothetical protein